MKSKLKEIIVFGCAAALLAGIVIFLRLSGGDGETKEEETAEVPPSTQLLYDKNPADIKLVTINNGTGEYTVEREGEGERAFWFIGELFGVPVDFEMLKGLVEASASLTSQQLVDPDAPDLSLYGLLQPRTAVRVEFSDAAGTVKELCIGNETPLYGKTYFCFAGEKAVHTVNTFDINVFLNDVYAYVEKTVYKPFEPSDPEDDFDYRRINGMVIRRKELDYEIVIEYDKRADNPDIVTGNSSSHIMTSPVRLDLSPDKSYDVMNRVFGLTATGIEILNPTVEQLEEYGLTDANGYIYMDIAGGDFQMLVGRQNGEKTGYYAYAEGIDVIYYFDSGELPWMTALPLDLTTSMITSNYIFDVSSVTLSGSGADARFALSGSGDDDFAVTLNGTSVDAKAFKTFYQFILKAPPEELYFDEPAGTPDLTVTIKTDAKTDTLSFTRLENRRSAVILNDKPSFTCKTAYVDRLLSNLRLLENGEKIVETW